MLAVGDLCMVTDTSKQAYREILPDLGGREQQVLNALKTIGCGNNKMIANIIHLGINQVTARMFDLRDFGYVTFSHEAPCPFTQYNTRWYKCTKYGEELGQLIENAKVDSLIVRPFIVTDGLDCTRYTAQMKSIDSKDFYNIELTRYWDKHNQEFYFKKICDCKAFQFRQDCKHCHRLESDLKRWNEI